MKMPKDYFVIALTTQNLIKDGYIFKEVGINVVEVTDEEGHKKVYADKEFKDWLLEKALDY